MNEEQNARVILGCRFCGIGFDSITGCPHTRPANFVEAPIPVLIGPTGVFLVDTGATVSIPIDSTTGLQITQR